MVTKQEIAGGWYSDITIDGDTTSLIRDQHIIFNGRIIQLPENENVLYLTMKRWKDVLFLAGQGNRSGKCWLWNSGSETWYSPCSTFGVNPCVFDYAGFLLVVIGPTQFVSFDLTSGMLSSPLPKQDGSQGFRYVDPVTNQPVTGEATYGPAPYNLAQFTDLGQYVIGQSYIDGAVALYQGEHYQVEPGNDCQFIRAYIEQDSICFCIDHPGIKAV